MESQERKSRVGAGRQRAAVAGRSAAADAPGSRRASRRATRGRARSASAARAELVQLFDQFLGELHEADDGAVMIIDEAHSLPPATMEQVIEIATLESNRRQGAAVPAGRPAGARRRADAAAPRRRAPHRARATAAARARRVRALRTPSADHCRRRRGDVQRTRRSKRSTRCRVACRGWSTCSASAALQEARRRRTPIASSRR